MSSEVWSVCPTGDDPVIVRTPRSNKRRRVGSLPSGEPYYAPMGRMRYDADRVQCHLCGRWLKMVGGSHLIAAHGITVAEYRETFDLHGNDSTVAPELSERKRRAMVAQIASGERDQSVLGKSPTATVQRWRSLAALHPELMAEWHTRRNADLDPFKIGKYSRLKVWWCCCTCGHVWQTTPHERTFGGRGCPACARRRRIAATIERNRRAEVRPERRLAVVRPDLLKEWHPARNGELDPLRIAVASERIVWWRCSVADCGREWRAMVGNRTKHGAVGCPRCAHRLAGERRARADRERSFGALHPHLLEEWHPTRNGGVDPYAIKPGSERRLWWRCANCGRDWQAPPMSRRRSVRGGCPTCAIRMARGIPLERMVWQPREMAARHSDVGVLGLEAEDEPRAARRESHTPRRHANSRH
jgi:predicted  nucleic acid-binding Zn-ribbon protein